MDSMENREAAHVVFVDDEPKVCQVVQKTLERTGVDVRCFHGAQDCLRHLAAHPCDLLITDVKMPGKDGMALLREVKEQLPWIPVLIVTGYGDVPLAVRALKAGAADFVEKPLDRGTFLQKVEQLLERCAEPAALQEESLTRTERRILYLLLDGRNNREIADVLHRSPRTIEVHRSHLMQKLGVANIIELLRRAAELGLLHAPPALPEDSVVPGPSAGSSGQES
jgi:FixJ family two-component response regulator